MSSLSINELEVEYKTSSGQVRAVDRVSINLDPGEIFGIVGESGCGKSTLANSILRLLDDNGNITSGSITYNGLDITNMSESELSHKVRGGKISMVFQDPTSSLDPVYTIGEQLIETIRQHLEVSKPEARNRAIQLLDNVGIPSPEDRLDDYPHAFSGGMRQRALLAIALSCDPGLLIADEPTTGLDVSIQAQILDLLQDLNENQNISILIITHNLGVVSEICDRVGVMYAGNIVETGPVNEIFSNPRHPYTQGLMNSLPEAHSVGEDLKMIPGKPPELDNPPKGCKYNPRCNQICSKACETGDIPPNYKRGEVNVRCYLHDPEENEDYMQQIQQEDG